MEALHQARKCSIVKRAHIGAITGIDAYVAEFPSEKAIGPESYLADKGLILLPDTERKKVALEAKK